MRPAVLALLLLSLPHAAAARPPEEAAVLGPVHAIAQGADAHDWDRVAAAFAPEAVLDYGTPETLTREQILSRWGPFLETFDRTVHLLRDEEVSIRGERATVRSRFRAAHLFRRARSGTTWMLTGRYEHELRRGPAGWQVTAMRMIPERSLGNSTLFEQVQEALRGRPAVTPSAASPRP